MNSLMYPNRLPMAPNRSVANFLENIVAAVATTERIDFVTNSTTNSAIACPMKHTSAMTIVLNTANSTSLYLYFAPVMKLEYEPINVELVFFLHLLTLTFASAVAVSSDTNPYAKIKKYIRKYIRNTVIISAIMSQKQKIDLIEAKVNYMDTRATIIESMILKLDTAVNNLQQTLQPIMASNSATEEYATETGHVEPSPVEIADPSAPSSDTRVARRRTLI